MKTKYALLKYANSREDDAVASVPNVLTTGAMTAGGAALGGLPGAGIGFLASRSPGLTGEIMAYSKDNPTKEEIRELNLASYPALTPGVSSYRDTRRRLFGEGVFTKDKDKVRRTTLSESIGPYTSALLPAAASSLGGFMLGGKFGKPILGATALGSLGIAVPNVLGRLNGNAAGERDYTESMRYYNHPFTRANNYLLPGVAAYNKQRSLRSTDSLMNDLDKWDAMSDNTLFGNNISSKPSSSSKDKKDNKDKK